MANEGLIIIVVKIFSFLIVNHNVHGTGEMMTFMHDTSSAAANDFL